MMHSDSEQNDTPPPDKSIEQEKAASSPVARPALRTRATAFSSTQTDQAAITPSASSGSVFKIEAANSASLSRSAPTNTVTTPSIPTLGSRFTFAEARAHANALHHPRLSAEQESAIKKTWREQGSPRCQVETFWNGRNQGVCLMHHPEALHENDKSVASGWIREEFSRYREQNGGQEPRTEENLNIKRTVMDFVGLPFDEKAERQKLADTIVRGGKKRRRDTTAEAGPSNFQNRANRARYDVSNSAPKKRRLRVCRDCGVKHAETCNRCYSCGRPGHLARDCRYSPLQDAYPLAPYAEYDQQPRPSTNIQEPTPATNIQQQRSAVDHQQLPAVHSNQTSDSLDSDQEVVDNSMTVNEQDTAASRPTKRGDDEESPRA